MHVGESELKQLLNTGVETIELDQKHIRFGVNNITLAWKIFTDQNSCNISHILSYPVCQQSNSDINITTYDKELTVSSEKLWLSGELADFSISSVSHLKDINCPILSDSVRINGKQ